MKNNKVHLFIFCLVTFLITCFVNVGNISHAAKITVTDAGIHQRIVTGSSANTTWKKSVSIIKGDVDNNGKVDSADITLLQKYLANPNTVINKSTADLNDDGKVSITDLSLLKTQISETNSSQTNATITQSYNYKVVYPANGLYSLQPMCAPNKELTVKDASTANNSNVFIYAIASNAHKHPSHQKWKIERINGTEWYKITAENSGKALNVHNGIAMNGTNVDIYPYGGRMHQFRFIDTGSGYYAIQANVGDTSKYNYVLDVENAVNANGTNVSIHQFTVHPAQRWRLVRRPAATIKAVEERKVLKGDVDGNGKVEQADLTLLMTYISDKSTKINSANADMNNDGKISSTDASQLMGKIPKEDTTKVISVTDGWYRIRRSNTSSVVSALAQVSEGQSAMVVTDGSDTQLKYNGSGYINCGYLFYLENNGNGYFTLKDGDRGRLLTADLSGQNATRVVCRSKNNSNAQLWRLLETGDGYYYIESKIKNRWAFSPHDGTTRTPVELRLWNIEEVPYKYNKWTVEKVDNNRILKGDVDGNGKVEKADLTLLTKYISNKSASIQRLALADMNGDGKITNTDASQLMLNLPKANNYKVAYPVNGLYSLQPMCAPQKELTVQNASTANNANVFIYAIASDWHKQPSHQKWYIERLGNSEWYKITAENSGKALNVHNGFAANGTNVDIYPYGARMHQFRFIDTGDGYYAIQANIGNISTASYVLDIAGGANANGANVQVWGFNAGNSQKWKLVSRPAATETGYIWPIENKESYDISCLYYYKRDKKYPDGRPHSATVIGYTGFNYNNAIDIALPNGTKILATQNGTVVEAGWRTGYGNCIIIRHADEVYSIYAHLSKIDVSVEQAVIAGNTIGLSGNTGSNSTGPHLHFGLTIDNTWLYFKDKIKFRYAVNCLYNNTEESYPYTARNNIYSKTFVEYFRRYRPATYDGSIKAEYL